MKLKEIGGKFRKIEDDLNLFALKIDGVYVWQYIRPFVFDEILKKRGDYGVAHTGLDKGPKKFMGMFLGIIKNLKRNFIFGSEREILFFSVGRKKKGDDGGYWNLFIDYLVDDLTSSSQSLEIPFEGRHLEPPKDKKVKYLDALMMFGWIFRKLIKVKFTNDEEDRIMWLEHKINKEFGISINLMDELKDRLKKRREYLLILDFILTIYKPKAIVEVCYYGMENMVLNELCKDKGIATMELQHGTMGPYHMAYDFPKGVKLDVFPDYFLSFGKYWEDCTNLPLPKNHIFTCGYPYLETEYKKYKKTKNNKQVLFISQGTIGKELSKIAVEFAEKGDYDVVYKLHPGEYSRWKEEYPWLLESKVKVIDNDNEPFYKLLAESYAQVGVYSTAIYEGLVFGLRTFIAELPGWENMADLIDGGYAVKVVDAAGLSRSLKSGKGKKLNVDYFFKKDSLSRQKRCIHDILEKKIINS
jgi:hypothetical protein